jgi:hypothetical protein
MLRMEGRSHASHGWAERETVLGQHDHQVQTGDVHIWHLADIIRAWPHVRY